MVVKSLGSFSGSVVWNDITIIERLFHVSLEERYKPETFRTVNLSRTFLNNCIFHDPSCFLMDVFITFTRINFEFFIFAF